MSFIPPLERPSDPAGQGRGITVPVLPNKPLGSVDEKDAYGTMALNFSSSLSFIQNFAFDPNLITYDRNYQNSQAYSARFLSHMHQVAAMLRLAFPRGATVVEVGCGKGDFLNLLSEKSYFQATGFDETYEGNNPRVYKRFLTDGDRITADLIVLRHTLEHIPQPHRFLQLLKTVFGNASIYIEVPDWDWIVANQAYIDITYEHVNYFSRQSLLKLFGNRWLKSGSLFDGQYQYVIAEISDISAEFESEFNSNRWREVNFYELFPSVASTISRIDESLTGNRKAYVWGAATKGCMFLVHCANLGKVLDKVRFAVDINPNKVGKFLPGSKVPIKSKDDFYASASETDLLIIANPSYKDEIVDEIRSSRLKNIEVISLS